MAAGAGAGDAAGSRSSGRRCGSRGRMRWPCGRARSCKSDELLLTSFAATRLRMELDRVPLWRGDHVAIKQLAEDFARYLYLPRLKDSAVLLGAIRDGVSLLTWEQDAFAFADSYDEAAGRYRGLRGGQIVSLADADCAGAAGEARRSPASSWMRRRREADEAAVAPGGTTTGGGGGTTPPGPGAGGTTDAPPPSATPPKRFHGTVTLGRHPRRPRCQPHRRRGDRASRRAWSARR